MTDSDRIVLVEALEKSKLSSMACFRIELVHGFYDGVNRSGDYWDIILAPVINSIYLLNEITDVVSKCDVHVAVYTDINRPGCIVFH